MARTLSVVAADDHALFREMLRLTLAQRPEEIELVAEAADAEAALRAVAKHHPDVLLLDLRLPKRATADLLDEVGALSPRTRIVVLTGFADDETVAAVARHGARAYVLKRSPLESLFEAIRRVALGEVWADPNLSAAQHREFLRLAAAQARDPQELESVLSRRELQVVRLVAEGLSNRAIAQKLAISEKTVTTHLNHIFEKLGVASRLQAALVFHHRSRRTTVEPQHGPPA
jgi:DNA-binding NarL/FixJ family response regulator